MRNLVASFVLVLAIVPGCSAGDAAPKRGKLSGRVTLDGKPVANGQLTLFALEATGTNVATKITAGQYDLPEGQGPSKGKYRVEFRVPSATKTKVPNPDIPGQFLEEPTETLPPRYNRESNIILDYDPDKSQTYDMDLQSR